ncbi:MAG: rod shape-determining protein MreC [Draconibacterium sp.]|nr:MAG: rod shape-determining protein MreC [Draconibacterium sp.]
MRSLLRYLLKNYAFLLFIVLEVISFLLVVNYNGYQKAKYLNSSSRIIGSVYKTCNSVISYVGLARVNRQLSEENAALRTQLANLPEIADSIKIQSVVLPEDSVCRFISARVINNSVNKLYNYFTLNKGKRDGIRRDQGVINGDGVVGVITKVSERFSLGFSVLNKRWGVSARHLKSGTFGPISWDGGDYRHVTLNGIPFHVDLAVGDTIVTSSYSSVFPENILVGTIAAFDKPVGENYYHIVVLLAVDFKSLSYVQVIDNLKREEILLLEKELPDD